jgi:hypothetical protein
MMLLLLMTLTMATPQSPQTANFESTVVVDNVYWRWTAGSSSNAEVHFREALVRATEIISRYCTLNVKRVLSRIAPIQFNSLEPGVLMQARAAFVSQGGIWVPMSLAIERETDLVYLGQLLQTSQYDIQITVNTGVDLIIGGPQCVWSGEDANAAFFSATTLLLHELLHGLGFYSLVAGQQGGGYQGAISLYDSLLRFTGNGSSVFGEPQRVQDVYGTRLGQYGLSIAAHAVYNPSTFSQGKSLSHLTEANSIMNAEMSPASCLFELDNATIDVMKLMGWRCDPAPGVHVPEQQLRCANSSECLCVINEICLPCEDAKSLDQLVTIILTLLFSLCLAMIITIACLTNFAAIQPHATQTTRFAPIINNF